MSLTSGRFLKLLVLFMSLFLTACHRETHGEAQGYIEGRYTYIASSVAGVLKELGVQKGSSVQQGQFLFALEQQPESDAYRAAVENLSQAISAKEAIIADLTFAKLTYQRYKQLVPKHAIDQSRLDNALSTLNATEAQLAEASASIAETSADAAQAAWRKEQKIRYAPVDGIVFDTYYRLGELTIATQPIMSLLAPSDIKAIFFVSEKVLGGLQLKDKVKVYCDACQDNIVGSISFISPSAEYTPPVIYSRDTSEKLIYRIEASFPPQLAAKLHPGQPVTVTYQLHE